jgi:predicted site-specific integrase-resolvase
LVRSNDVHAQAAHRWFREGKMDMVEVLTSMCARLYGRRGARNRAMRAVTATKQEPGEAAL